MNPYNQTNNPAQDRHLVNVEMRPTGTHSFNNPQIRTVQREQVQPNGRFVSNDIPQNYQQRQNAPENYPQHNSGPFFPQQNYQMQQNQGFPTNGSFQMGQRPSFESQRFQMPMQNRYVPPQQPVRPNNNANGGGFLHQHLPQNHSLNGPSRISNEMTQNHNSQIQRDSSGVLFRKSSELDLKQQNLINNQTSVENGSQRQSVTGLENKNTEEKSEVLTEAFNSSQPKVTLLSKNNVEGNENVNLTKIKGPTRKEANDENIIKKKSINTGMVLKNIKYFEEHDTAKKPLRPETFDLKSSTTHSESSKSINDNTNHDRGVDETPVIHPNLNSIFQKPRKVAKIPQMKGTKKLKSKRSALQCSNEKTKIPDGFKFARSYFPYKPGYAKIQKVKSYSSEEELLAFFENTKLWRKLNRREQNATNGKVEHKPTTNGGIPTPKKTPSKLSTPSKRNLPTSPMKTPLKSPGTPGTPGGKSLPKTPDSPAPSTPLIKKVPMNKIQVGAAPSPNLKVVKSKIGSLANTTHKPGGGNVKIETHKIDLSNVQPRTAAKNDNYKPSGGDKKIQQVKLQWSAQSKVGSLENATYKPGGGDKKIESVKLDFKEKAKPKVGSKDNVKHVPGGGNVKIENQKLEIKAQSKVGSLDNVKHKPGGGDVKIFDDKTYLRQVSANSSEGRASGTQANSDFSVSHEVEGVRSSFNTPIRRRMSIKLKNVTTIETTGNTVKKGTEAMVTSETPKKEKNLKKSPTKVKAISSKLPSSKSKELENSVGIIKLPANKNAPIFNSNLSQKNSYQDFEVQNIVKLENIKTSESITADSLKLSNDKLKSDDFEIPKSMQNDMSTREKAEELWKERNIINRSNYSEQGQNERSNTSFSEIQKSGPSNNSNNPQFNFMDPQFKL